MKTEIYMISLVQFSIDLKEFLEYNLHLVKEGEKISVRCQFGNKTTIMF